MGRLCTTTDASGTTTYAYDAWGNVVEETFTHAGVAFTTTTTYDASNRVLTQTNPTGHTVTYTRDTVGRLTAIDLTFPDGTTQPIAGAIALPGRWRAHRRHLRQRPARDAHL